MNTDIKERIPYTHHAHTRTHNHTEPCKEIFSILNIPHRYPLLLHLFLQVSTFHKALQTGLEYERQTKALLLRLDLIRNDMSIKQTRCHGPPRGDREED